MQVELGNIIVAGVVQTAIGTFFWLAVRKTVEKVDDLQKQVSELKDKRVAVIEELLREHGRDNDARFAAAASSRKQLHEGLAEVRETYVKQASCASAMERFAGAVVDLARVEEKIDGAAKWISKVQDGLIAQGQDLARLQGAAQKGASTSP